MPWGADYPPNRPLEPPQQLRRPDESGAAREFVRHLCSLLLGVGYVFVITVIANDATKEPFALCLLIVTLGFVAQMVVTSLLALQFIRSGRQEGQFSITTIMLVTFAMAIYFAAIGVLFKTARTIGGGPTLQKLFGLLVLGTIFVVFSSSIVLLFTRSLVLASVVCLRMYRKSRVGERRQEGE